MKHIPHLLLIAAAASLVSCATSSVQTKESQAALTPQQVIKKLQDGNERFASGHSTKFNLTAQVKATSGGQHPIAAVLGCMDSRASHELVFDQGIGDIFSVRVAGNVVSDDVLGSLEYGTAKAGAKAIIVLAHTSCGAVGGACHDVKLGHVTGLVSKIKPSVSKVSSDSKSEHSGPAFENKVSAENAKHVAAQLREQSPILARLAGEGKIVIKSGIYHIDTGRVEFLD
jgi:carbonic anhydrase